MLQAPRARQVIPVLLQQRPFRECFFSAAFNIGILTTFSGASSANLLSHGLFFGGGFNVQ